MNTTDELHNTLDWDEVQEEVESDRHKYCGRKFKKTDRESGVKVKFTFICGDYRNCHWCCREKATEEMRLVEKGLIKEGKNLVITECSPERGKYLCRLQRDDSQPYRKYTLPNGNSLILHCDEKIEGQVIKERKTFEDLPFEKWIMEMPKRKKVSGSGSMKKVVASKPKSEAEIKQINLVSIWTDAPEEAEEKCWKQAVNETEGPKDWTEVEKACNRRTLRFKNLLEQAGYTTYCVSTRDTVCSDIKLNWGIKEKVLNL